MNHYDRGMSAFDGLFVPAELRAAVSARAWLEAMLDAERALANAGASRRHRARRTSRPRSRRPATPSASTSSSSWTKAARSATRRASGARPRGLGRRRGRALRAPRRDEPGHRRHGRDARLPAGARARARGSRRRGGGRRGARARSPRHADGRPDSPAARRADDLRPQGRRLADSDRRGPRATRAGVPGTARCATRRRGRDAGGVRRRAASRCSTSTRGSSTFRRRRSRGTRTGLASPSSALLSRPLPVSRRRSPSTSCCSPRPRSPRWPRAVARDAPRRCRRSATRSARRSHARAHGSPRLTPASSSGRWSRSTSAPRAPGRPSGTRWSARSRTPAVRCTRSRARSSRWRSTLPGCGRTST